MKCSHSFYVLRAFRIKNKITLDVHDAYGIMYYNGAGGQRIFGLVDPD